MTNPEIIHDPRPQMPPANNQKPGRRKPKAIPPPLEPSTDELTLHGDISGLTYAFVGHPRRLVTCPVPDSVYLKLQNYPGGVSRFYEDAIAAFDGDLNALVAAAVAFVDNRRDRAATDPPRNASGRVLPLSFEKIEKVQSALSSVRGMSRAKVLAGLIALNLRSIG